MVSSDQMKHSIEHTDEIISGIDPALTRHNPGITTTKAMHLLSDEISLILIQMRRSADNAITLLRAGRIYDASNEIKIAKAMKLRSMILAYPELNYRQIQNLIKREETK